MNILDDVIYGEIKKREGEVNALKKELDNLPKGTLFFRRMNNSVYAYRKWKENGKVKSVYLGKVGNSKTMDNIAKVSEYKSTKMKYKKAVKNLNDYKKAYRLIIEKTNIN